MTIGSLPIGGDAIGGDAAGGVRIPRRGWYPCCCPSPDLCVVLRDNFDRDEVGSDWIADAGSWAIVDETLRTSSASAQLRHVDIEVPSPVAFGFWARARVSATDAGDQVEVELGAFFWRVRLEFQPGSGNGTVALIYYHPTLAADQIVAECAVTAEPGETYELGITLGRAPFEPSALPSSAMLYTTAALLDGVIVGSGCTSGGVPPPNTFDVQPMLSTGTLTGTATFDNFRVSATEMDDRECRHVQCCYPFALEPPAQVRVEVAGLANGESSGCDCADNFEGTYYADLVTDFTGLAFDPDDFCAVYRYEFETPIVCSTRTVEALFVLIDPYSALARTPFCRAFVRFTNADASAIALFFAPIPGTDNPCELSMLTRQRLVSGENICDSTNFNEFSPSNPHGTATVMPA